MKLFSSILQRDWQDKLINVATKRAPEEGRHGRPSPDALHFDKNEAEFKNTVENLIRKARNIVFDQIRKIDKNLGKQEVDLQTVQHETENRSTVEALRQDAISEMKEQRDSYLDLLVKRTAAEGNLNAFKVINNINHGPDHPADQMHFMSLVFLVFVAECIFNAAFWKGDDGLAGGILIAASFAIVNIALALLLGTGFRFKNLNAPRAKFLGWAALTVAVGAAWLIAVWIATQRSSKEITRFLTPDLGAAFSTVPSALFLGGTILAAVIAFYKGYHVLGSVPGYKRVFEDFEKLDQAAEEIRLTIRKTCAGIYDKAIDQCSASVRQLKDIQKEATAIQSELRAVRSEYDLTMGQILNGYRTVMKRYRETNLASRPSDINGPSYWNDLLELDVSEPEELQHVIDRADLLSVLVSDLNAALCGPLLEEKNQLIMKKSEFFSTDWDQFVSESKQNSKQNFEKKIHYLGKAA